MSRAVAQPAPRSTTANGPASPTGSAREYLRALGDAIMERADAVADAWARETGTIHKITQYGAMGAKAGFEQYAALADTFAWEEPAKPSMPGWGLLVREPVGTVGAIIPWNSPLGLIPHKIGPALLAGCTVVLKLSPEAPGEGYLVAEAAEQVGLPPGVLNVVTADREVSELLVRDPRIDKITFTGSTAAGRKIGAICGERIARVTLELGGKSAAVILDDVDIAAAAAKIAGAECVMTGQVCSSLTRIVVTRKRHDEMVEALAAASARCNVGDPFDEQTQMGPLAMQRQRDRVEGYIAKGLDEGATPRGRRRTPEAPGPRLVRRADRLRQRRQRVDHRAGRDLRARAQRDPRRRRAAMRFGSRTTRSTGSTPRCSRTMSTAHARSPGSSAPARSDRTRSAPTSGSRSAASSSRASAARAVVEGLRHFLETKTVILDEAPDGYDTAG